LNLEGYAFGKDCSRLYKVSLMHKQ